MKNQVIVTLDSCRYCPYKKHSNVMFAGPGKPRGKHPVCTLVRSSKEQARETGFTGDARVLPRALRDRFGHGSATKEWYDTNEIPDWCPNISTPKFKFMDEELRGDKPTTPD